MPTNFTVTNTSSTNSFLIEDLGVTLKPSESADLSKFIDLDSLVNSQSIVLAKNSGQITVKHGNIEISNPDKLAIQIYNKPSFIHTVFRNGNNNSTASMLWADGVATNSRNINFPPHVVNNPYEIIAVQTNSLSLTASRSWRLQIEYTINGGVSYVSSSTSLFVSTTLSNMFVLPENTLLIPSNASVRYSFAPQASTTVGTPSAIIHYVGK